MHPISGVCDVCDVDTRWWLARDLKPVLNGLRWSIFRRMSTSARHALEISVQDLDLAALELIFTSFGAGELEEALLSDSEEEEDICVKKILQLNGFQQV